MAGWIKMPLGMELGLGLGDFVLDEDPALPSPKRGRSPQFWAYVYCSQRAGWIKMALGMKVGLGHRPGHIVLDGDPAPLPKKWHSLPKFSAHFCCGQTAVCIRIPLGTEGGLSLGNFVLDRDPASPPLKGYSPQFSVNVRCRETAGWMKTPLGAEVDLGSGHIVLDGDPAPPRAFRCGARLLFLCIIPPERYEYQLTLTNLFYF